MTESHVKVIIAFMILGLIGGGIWLFTFLLDDSPESLPPNKAFQAQEQGVHKPPPPPISVTVTGVISMPRIPPTPKMYPLTLSGKEAYGERRCRVTITRGSDEGNGAWMGKLFNCIYNATSRMNYPKRFITHDNGEQVTDPPCSEGKYRLWWLSIDMEGRLEGNFQDCLDDPDYTPPPPKKVQSPEEVSDPNVKCECTKGNAKKACEKAEEAKDQRTCISVVGPNCIGSRPCEVCVRQFCGWKFR